MSRDDTTWIQCYSGQQFWPLDPLPEDVHIEDIAHALALKCRFAGHTNGFYSVAQHSVLVSQNVPLEDALWGLLHDAAEAYLADLARPVKHHPDFAPFCAAEDRIMRCVAIRFGLGWPQPDSVSHADLILLRTERRDLLSTPSRPWRTDLLAQPLIAKVVAWNWGLAEQCFLRRFEELHP